MRIVGSEVLDIMRSCKGSLALIMMALCQTLLLAGCIAINEMPPPKAREAISVAFASSRVSQQVLFELALKELLEEGFTIERSEPGQGILLASILPTRLRNVEGASAVTILRNISTGTLFARIDVQKPDQGESVVFIQVKKSNATLPGDPYVIERDFMDSYKLRVEKHLARSPTEPTKLVLDPVDKIQVLTSKGKRNGYAVLIGVESYRDLPQVDFAQRDVDTVKGYLMNTLGYPEENIMVRTNEHATRSDFETYFERWLENNVEAGSEVFVYYAGHGSPHPKSGQPFLVPFDGNPQYLDKTGYAVERMYQALAKLPTDKIIVVLDSCFSGTGGRSVVAKGSRPVGLTIKDPALPAAGGKKMAIFSASRNNQISLAFPEKQHGLFTYFFLKGFQGAADTDRNGRISIGELHEYVRTEVQRQSRRMNSEQTPQLTTAGWTQSEAFNISIVELPR